MKHLCILFLSYLVLIQCVNDKRTHYTFNTIEIFKNTEIKKLAHYASRNDTLAMANFIDKHPSISIDTPDPFFKSSLLMWTISNGKYEAFICLLNHGASPDYEGGDGETPMYFACKYIDQNYEEDHRYCQELIKRGVDVNRPMLHDLSAVYLAAMRGNLRCTQLLVENGADLTIGKGNWSVADIALIQGHIHVAEYLICEADAPLYNIPDFDKYLQEIVPQKEDSEYEKVVSEYKETVTAWNRVKAHLQKHPELLQYKYHLIRKDPILDKHGNQIGERIIPDVRYAEDVLNHPHLP